jgi:hypothetical protein
VLTGDSSSRSVGAYGLHQRIYKTKKPRQRTRRPKTGPWSEFNVAILLNIWSAITPLSFSFDTMDPSLSWGGATMSGVKGEEGWRNGPI